MSGERLLSYKEIGQLLGVGERAALNWVKEQELPIVPGRPTRVALADVVARATALHRSLAILPDDSEVDVGRIRNDSEASGSPSEPIEASYTVAGEPGRTLVPLTEVLGQVAGLTEQLATLAARNEGLALEVGQLRERTVGHEAQLGAKDETIAAQRAALATKDQALAADVLALAALRRRAEAAEAERDRLTAAQAAPAAPGSTEASTPDNPRLEPSAGFWARVRRVFGGDER